MNQTGKVGRQWQAARRLWFKNNRPNHEGYYVCHYCGDWVLEEHTTLDHKESRGRAPELRNEQSNFVPCCSPCNTKKGSRSHDEFPHYCLDAT